MHIEGRFHLANQSRNFDAWITFLDNDLENKHLHLVCTEAHIDKIFPSDQYSMDNSLPSLPISVRFADGSVFTPLSAQQEAFKQWSHSYRKGHFVAWLERSRSALLATILLLPFILISFYYWGIPALASASVNAIPYVLQQHVGDQTLAILEKSSLSDSKLPISLRDNIEDKWRTNLDQLNVPDRENFQLLFRQSKVFRNNAFALTNHTIVLTDSLVSTMDNNNDQIQAILLHETGHIVHQHGLQTLLESAYISLFTTLFLGDNQSLGDTFVSVGTGVVNSSFSRDMEREADQFAIDGLKQLNHSSAAFAAAMEKLPHGQNSENTPWVVKRFLEIFSSHPERQERIDVAK